MKIARSLRELRQHIQIFLTGWVEVEKDAEDGFKVM
jgi:hypothetical protein